MNVLVKRGWDFIGIHERSQKQPGVDFCCLVEGAFLVGSQKPQTSLVPQAPKLLHLALPCHKVYLPHDLT